jgi:hypothetical protein
MPLENANTISELNPNEPQGTDPVSEGNEHIKMIKRVLINDTVSESNKLYLLMEGGSSWDGTMYANRWGSGNNKIGNEIEYTPTTGSTVKIDISGEAGTNTDSGGIHSLGVGLDYSDGSVLCPMQKVWTIWGDGGEGSFLYRNIITSPGGPMKFWIVVAHLGDFQVATGDHFKNVTVVIEEFESK